MKMLKGILTITVLSLILIPALHGQGRTESKPGGPDALDFWVGKWKLTWKDKDGSIATGKNKIKKILKDKVIKEEFKVLSGTQKDFKGRSLSVYNPRTGEWNQTWVDSQSAYMTFTGEFAGDRRIFKREFKAADGKIIKQRMVFYNIKTDEFDWDWELSTDNGSTWKKQWSIHYTRDKSKKNKKKKKEKNEEE